MDNSKKTNIALTVGIISGLFVITIGTITIVEKIRSRLQKMEGKV